MDAQSKDVREKEKTTRLLVSLIKPECLRVYCITKKMCAIEKERERGLTILEFKSPNWVLRIINIAAMNPNDESNKLL
jgi:hypothetical protein